MLSVLDSAVSFNSEQTPSNVSSLVCFLADIIHNVMSYCCFPFDPCDVLIAI